MHVVSRCPKILNSLISNNFLTKLKHGMPKAAMPGKKKKANGYEFPDPLPLGEILKDVGKKEWCLGSSIGKGGFGEIYAACEAGSKSKVYPYAIKVEPHANGPLFVERSFYIKVCKPEKLEEWKKKKDVKLLGVPSLQGFGSHMYQNKNYRFVVMDRFGKDLWSLFLENKKVFAPRSVFTYAIQILDALEYIHSTGYVHADIKGANLLFGFSKGTENNLFLIDFGLACRYSSDKEFKRDPKKAHDGTIEYTSRDFHQGVPTRRGDMEILGYNLLHWLKSSLPWEKNITNPDKVFEAKNDLMSSVKTKLASFAPNIPSVITEYLEYVSKMNHLEEPHYDKCRSMFQKALNKLPKGGKVETPSKIKGKSDSRKSPRKRGRAGTSKEQTGNEDLEDEAMIDKENESEEEIVSPTKRLKSTPNKKKKATWKNAPLCEPGSIATARKTKQTKTDSESSTDELSATNKPALKSWRDCPTVKASNIAVAGQYTRKTTAKPTRTKK